MGYSTDTGQVISTKGQRAAAKERRINKALIRRQMRLAHGHPDSGPLGARERRRIASGKRRPDGTRGPKG